MQKVLGERAMKIKFICFCSEEGNKLACVRMNLARAILERRRRVKRGEGREKREDEQGLIWIIPENLKLSFCRDSKTEAFPQVSPTLRLFTFLIFSTLHVHVFPLF